MLRRLPRVGEGLGGALGLSGSPGSVSRPFPAQPAAVIQSTGPSSGKQEGEGDGGLVLGREPRLHWESLGAAAWARSDLRSRKE